MHPARTDQEAQTTTVAPTTPVTPTIAASRITSRSATLLQGVAIAVLLATIGWVAVRLVAQGPIPAATLQPTRDRQAVTARLVAQGLIPAETLRPASERAGTRSLINRGLIPEGTQP